MGTVRALVCSWEVMMAATTIVVLLSHVILVLCVFLVSRFGEVLHLWYLDPVGVNCDVCMCVCVRLLWQAWVLVSFHISWFRTESRYPHIGRQRVWTEREE